MVQKKTIADCLCELKALLRKTSVSQEVIIEFKKDCMKVLTCVVEKIQER